jgi:hypothetical protein
MLDQMHYVLVGVLRVQYSVNKTKAIGDLRAIHLMFSNLTTNIHIISNEQVCSISCLKDKYILGNFIAKDVMCNCMIDVTSTRGGSTPTTSPLVALILESGTVRGCLKQGMDSLQEMLNPDQINLLYCVSLAQYFEQC